MITLFVLVAPHVFPAAELESARNRLEARAAVQGRPGGSEEAEPEALGLAARLRSKTRWADAAGYAVSDVTMLRRELLIGYLVAGVLAVAVPSSAYDVVFLSGHGALTELENVIVGPLVAFISFVCSIANVPLAAALFKGGLSFGGTVAFVFADLITVPLVVIYGKFYGRRLALRLFFSFWAVMSAAGLVTDLLFRALRIPAPGRAPVIAATHFQWNCTTHLNIVFLVVAVVVSWLYRNRARFGDDGGYAKDMVCGMQVERAHAPATHVHDGRSYYFCFDRCEEKFVKEPAKYLADPGAAPMGEHASPGSEGGQDVEEGSDTAVDPVVRHGRGQGGPAATHVHGGITYYFCSQGCHDAFAGSPSGYLSGGGMETVDRGRSTTAGGQER